MNGEPRTSNDTESARADKPRVYDLEERLLEFSVQIIEVSEALPKTRAGNHIAASLFARAPLPTAITGRLSRLSCAMTSFTR